MKKTNLKTQYDEVFIFGCGVPHTPMALQHMYQALLNGQCVFTALPGISRSK